MHASRFVVATGSGTINWSMADLPVYDADFIPFGETLTLTYTVTVTAQTTATQSSPVGSYPITATVTGADAANYTITVVPSTLVVSKAPLYISASNVAVSNDCNRDKIAAFPR